MRRLDLSAGDCRCWAKSQYWKRWCMLAGIGELFDLKHEFHEGSGQFAD